MAAANASQRTAQVIAAAKAYAAPLGLVSLASYADQLEKAVAQLVTEHDRYTGGDAIAAVHCHLYDVRVGEASVVVEWYDDGEDSGLVSVHAWGYWQAAEAMQGSALYAQIEQAARAKHNEARRLARYAA